MGGEPSRRLGQGRPRVGEGVTNSDTSILVEWVSYDNYWLDRMDKNNLIRSTGKYSEVHANHRKRAHAIIILGRPSLLLQVRGIKDT